jgi:hypothetical protein
MMNLTETLERWADLSPRERDALVAEHVMGWKVDSHGDILGTTESSKGSVVAITHIVRWSPTTDHKDMVAAVRALRSNHKDVRRKAIAIFNSEYDGYTAFGLFLEKPDNVCYVMCRAMLQALAESEGDDVR